MKMLPSGKEVILEVFGAGEPLGAVAVYEGRPFPASAIALEDTSCIVIPRRAFFALLEQYPTLVRGILTGLTLRLIELTRRLAELSGGRVEARFARLFLKLAQDVGRPAATGGRFVALPLSRQELADMTGTTIETCIRIMSRWGKDEIVRTEKDGFTVLDTTTLQALAES
jgi:CRP/FNR family transcriptional regulator